MGPKPVTLLQGDCLEVMASLEAGSVDAVVCDPPYGIAFNGAKWDGQGLRQAAVRGSHNPTTTSEAFQAWSYMLATECRRPMKPGAHLLAFGSTRTHHRLACGIEDAGLEIRDTLMWLYGTGMPKSRRYAGGRRTTLKPAVEPIVLARRPLEGTTEETIARYGTGALNAEACSVEGRPPANVVLSHEPGCRAGECSRGCAVALVDASARRSRRGAQPSRFLYCVKASRSERDAGCEHLRRRPLDLFPNAPRKRQRGAACNPHPTVKPLAFMRWAVRLSCPPGGLVLDPTCGSGTTGAATLIEGRRFVGIELDPAYLEIADARIRHWGHAGRAKGERS